MFDRLESRVLLANVGIVNGILRIEGTSADDSIAVARFNRTQAQVVDGGSVVLTFNLSDVRAISFAGGQGNDLITIGRANVRSYLSGGDGNDSLSAAQGMGSDTLIGGDGNDYLFGGDGADTLDGGAGGDTMLGDAGDDLISILSDNTGDDLVSGGDGTDTIDAAAYPVGVVLQVGNADPNNLITSDTIFGDVERVLGSGFGDDIIVVSGRLMYVDLRGGNDTLTTGRGNDTIIGGAGTDLINSAGGIDLIDGSDGETDTLTGGSGDDTATADAFDVLDSIENS